MKERAKSLLIMSAVVNMGLATTIFPLVKTTIIKGISQSVYLTGDWMSTILLLGMTKLFMSKSKRDSIIDKHMYKIMVVDICLYILVLGISLNGNLAFRYISVCILSGTTSYIWNVARSVYTKRTFHGEELIALDQKIEYYVTICSIVGGAIGIALAQLHMSYVPLCIAQIVIIIIMTVTDFMVFNAFRKIPVETTKNE